MACLHERRPLGFIPRLARYVTCYPKSLFHRLEHDPRASSTTFFHLRVIQIQSSVVLDFVRLECDACISIFCFRHWVKEHESVGATLAGVVLLVEGHFPRAVKDTAELIYKVPHRVCVLHPQCNMLPWDPVLFAFWAGADDKLLYQSKQQSTVIRY